MYALGLAIDSCVNSSRDPWFAVFAYWASLSRSGPTLPFVPAGLKAWQPPQPWALKSVAPALASPFVVCAFATVPTTVSAVGLTVWAPPQPASRKPSTRNGARRRIGASLLKPSTGPFASRQQPEAERREAAVARHVGGRVVDEERDGEGHEVGVEQRGARPLEREDDEADDPEREQQRVVPGRGDRRSREVQAVAEVAEHRAGPAADRLGDVARAAGCRVDPDQQQRRSGRDGCCCGRSQRGNTAQAQPEHEEAGEVDDEAAAVGAYAARRDPGGQREADHR